jgi:tRNA(Arg) A34 adenosine deaminase TadA
MTTVLHPHTESDFMGLAFRQAEAAATRDEVPIGAVLVDSTTGQVLAANHNRVEELHDPTAHAEMLVIRTVSTGRKEKRLPLCDLYVTLEPCPMCAGAISFARIRRLVFAARDPKGGGVEHGPRIFQQPTCHHRPEVFGGLDETRSATLLKTFFQSKR